MSSSPCEIRGLTKQFDDVGAVDGLSLTLEPDELLALVGPSGCGKSTLLRSIAGLIAIDSGTIHLAGELVDDGRHQIPPERRATGLVFQEHALFPHLTVAGNVGFGVRDSSKADVATRVAEMLALVDLGGHADRFPHELSGGERQRVALARALAPSPALMLFDEPFASLDQNLRVRLRQVVTDALRTTGTPGVFVTHDQQEALAIGNRIAVMRNGKIIQLGTPAEIYHEPVDTFVGAFMGEAGFLPVTDGASAVGMVEGATPDSVAMVRSDDLRFTLDPAGDTEIVRVEYHGTMWHMAARMADGTIVPTTAVHLESPAIGDRGRLELVPGHTQVAVTRR